MGLNLATLSAADKLRMEAHKIACFWRWKMGRGTTRQEAWKEMQKLKPELRELVVEQMKKQAGTQTDLSPTVPPY